jgi:hypothetical protein
MYEKNSCIKKILSLGFDIAQKNLNLKHESKS